MFHVLWSIIVGFIVGLIAKVILPVGHMGFIVTTLVGVAGSIIGGLIARIFNAPQPGARFHRAGFILSILGAIILLLIVRWVRQQ